MRATRWTRLGVLAPILCVAAVACGGESRSHDETGTGGAPNAGLENRSGSANGGRTVGTGGTAGTGGTTTGGAGSGPAGIGGTSSPSASCDTVPKPSNPACTQSCAIQAEHRNPICVDGAWGCYPDQVPVWECAPDSCNIIGDHECCGPDGHSTAVTCTPAGTVEPCPDGAVNLAPGALCVTKAETVTRCEELDNQPCDHVGDRCALVRKCSEQCECSDSPDGPHWSCITPVC